MVAHPESMTQDVEEVRRIVLSRLGSRARAFLYGSHARGEASKASDIDVGIMPLESLDASELSEIRDAVEQSNILSLVDVVDLSQADEAFRQHVLQDAIEWTG